jgi:tRNA-Thr(GGU) m(6)t(6)A37 methyltransferase TsaA
MKNDVIRPIGVIRSELTSLDSAPRLGEEGAPDAFLEVVPEYQEGLDGMLVGDEMIVITWLHHARRDVLKVRPRRDPSNPLTGVFRTRSPHRPNPLGLHRVKVLEVRAGGIKIGPIEAIDQTPVVDIKPVAWLNDY